MRQLGCPVVKDLVVEAPQDDAANLGQVGLHADAKRVYNCAET